MGYVPRVSRQRGSYPAGRGRGRKQLDLDLFLEPPDP